jgi:peptidoglycan/LPS O-acetylase OafA/YrhL
MSALQYRADIDGLRAVAVLSVIMFHLSSSLLPGGYLGVDMFFVLSGYLITAIISKEIDDKSFTILQFYERRIRRIMPALLFMLAVITALAMVLLLPADLIGYGRSLFATLAFVANMYFLRDTNYFARAAEEKPLLHIWSLGVEEQFYVIFPILLALTARYWPRGVLPVVAASTFISFALNLWMLSIGGDTPAFYLLPTRAWELGVGAVIALLPTRLAPRGTTAATAAVMGAILVGIGLVFPGDVSVLSLRLPVPLGAVIGTGLLIWAATAERPFVSRLAAAAPVVLIGQISYSLYLWHWPIIVFFKYYLVRELALLETALAVALMAVCAVVSWRYIERPFRNRSMTYGTVLRGVGSAVVLLAAAGGAVLSLDGLPNRLGREAAAINSAIGTNFRCPVSTYLAFGGSRACLLNLPSRNPRDAELVLFGNSHAQMYAPLIEEIARAQNRAGLLVPMNGCMPTQLINLSPACSAMAKLNLDEILKLPKAKVVVIGMTWGANRQELFDANGQLIAEEQKIAALIAGLDDILGQIKKSGRRAVLIGPIEYPGWDIASVVSREMAFSRPSVRGSSVPIDNFQARFGTAFAHFEARLGRDFIRPDRVMCDKERCDFIRQGRSFFADSNHIAQAELVHFRAPFETALQQ